MDLPDIWILQIHRTSCHLGLPDIQHRRFIDEQEGGRDRSASPNYHSLIYGRKSEKEAGTNGAEVRPA